MPHRGKKSRKRLRRMENASDEPDIVCLQSPPVIELDIELPFSSKLLDTLSTGQSDENDEPVIVDETATSGIMENQPIWTNDNLPTNRHLLFQQTEDLTIIVLDHGDTLPFIGYLEFTVIFGSCKIFGFEMSAKEDYGDIRWVPVCSSNVGCPVLEFTNNFHDINPSSETFRSKRSKLKLKLKHFCQNDVMRNEILSLINEKTCCFVARKSTMSHNPLDYLKINYPQVFGIKKSLPVIVPNAFIINEKMNRNVFRDNDEHMLTIKNLLNDILCSIRDCQKNYILLVAGSSNSGKSTFIRHFLNTIFNQNLNVYHLDCDCGQTEFTIPGCLSLTKINEPIFGDPFSHLKDSELCYYFGDVSPSVRTDQYLQLIDELNKRFDAVSETKPSLLVVNTNGWTMDRGADALLEVLTILKPNKIVCLQGVVAVVDLLKNHLPAIPLAILNSVTMADVDLVKNRVLTRELAVASYFGRLISNFGVSSLREIVPYAVPWKNITVSIINGSVPPDYLLSVLNANIVALCCSSKKLVSDSKAHWFDDFESPLVLPNEHFSLECLGFGIVRAVDTKMKLFYIVTPLVFEKLQKVDVLVKGVVSLPTKLMLNEKSSDSIFILNKWNRKKETKVSKALSRTLRIVSRYKKRRRELVQ